MPISLDSLQWLDLNLGGVSETDVDRQRRTAQAILKRLYGKGSVPGVILADEVGMGKTYVSLAVAATLFKHRGKSVKIIVLAPGAMMKETWKQRWDQLRNKQRHPSSFPLGRTIYQLDEAASGISFGSYEEMKFTSGGEVRAVFEQAITGRNRPRGITRRRLLKQLFQAKRLSKIPPAIALRRKPAKGKLERFWQENYDAEQRTWNSPYSAYRSLQRLIFRSRRPRDSVADLIVFDEAHRMTGQQRQAFFSEALSSRTKRTLFVTATPFSLDVEELLDRIEELYSAAGAEDKSEMNYLRKILNEFRNIVRSREELPEGLKNSIETVLGKYLVRNTWPNCWNNDVRRREPHELRVEQNYLNSREQAFATFAMERKFIKMLSEDRRMYIASHRETLCSSFSAIKASNRESIRTSKGARGYFDDVVSFLPRTSQESPKFEFALYEIAHIVGGVGLEPEKIVVFCNRNATIRTLKNRLAILFAPQEIESRRRWNRAQKTLRRLGWKGDWPKAKLAAYISPDFAPREATGFIHKLEEKISRAPVEGDFWSQTWGLRRHVYWVSTITGERSQTDRPNENVQFAFNLPGPPYVLLCSEKGRESIDLHRWCRRIVHYDLDWNPSVMEQKVGRIDRVNSLAERTKKPIEIYYFRIKGTYEERILKVVKERMEMSRVLLGAGEWLQDVENVREAFGRKKLDKYILNFAPMQQKEKTRLSL